MTDRELLELLLQKVSGLKGQLHENTDIIKSLVHRAEEIDAQLHSFGHTLTQVQGRLTKTATKNDIDRLAEDINFIMKKVADHDTDIRNMRKAE